MINYYVGYASFWNYVDFAAPLDNPFPTASPQHSGFEAGRHDYEQGLPRRAVNIPAIGS